MPLPQSLRSMIPLVIGLTVGGVGAALFLQSMPGAEGSPEERANRLELELKRAQNRIAALEASLGDHAPAGTTHGIIRRLTGSPEGRQAAEDAARRLAEDLKEGRSVNPEDIFRASQPFLKTVAPVFDRMRVREQRRAIDSMAGELARKYDLTPGQQDQLKQYFQQQANADAKAWSDMMGREGTTLEDMMKASRNVRPDTGLDSFMPTVLHGEKLEQFRTERLAERAQRVEAEADMRVQRLDSVVGLDEAQRDRVFGIVARSSKDYDPQMVLEGATGEISASPTGNSQEAMLSVLRPEQRAAYDAERKRRRDKAAQEMEEIGLALPPNWDMFDDDFR